MTLPATGASEVFSLEPQYPASCMSMVELVFLRSLQLMKKEKVFEMKLTKEEKKMLDGDEGSAKQKAMELIVRYGGGYRGGSALLGNLGRSILRQPCLFRCAWFRRF
jgi:hypothetical protein